MTLRWFNRLFLTVLLMGILVPIGQSAFAQKLGKLYLTGKVVDEKKKGMPSKIYIYREGKKVEEFETSRIGRFEFSVELQDSVAFVVLADGYVSKTVFVDTRIPEHKQSSDYNFPFFIDLYPVGRIPSNIDLKRPVGKIVFARSQFIYDIEFTKKQNERLKDFVRERKDLKIREINE